MTQEQTISVTLIPALKDNYIHLLHNHYSDEIVVVDPTEAPSVLALTSLLGKHLSAIWNTHHHSDHIGGNAELEASTNCQILASAYDHSRIPSLDISLDDGDSFSFGNVAVNVLATPGHTLGHICYHISATKQLFAGDTLFAMGCGRLFEGTAEQMWNSLEKIKRLPPDTMIYCAHEYTDANAKFALTIEPHNQELKERVEVVKSMRQKGLPTLPTKLDLELATNPFLRADQPAVKESLGMVGSSDWQVFAKIRQLKDRF